MSRLWVVLAGALTISACQCNEPQAVDGGPGGGSSGGSTGGGVGGGAGGGFVLPSRCETDWSQFIVPASGGARVSEITSPTQLIGGPNAQGRVGDFLFQNGRIRVVVQGGGRVFGPLPYGGTILDADLVHPDAGNDQFGEVGLLFNFGRTVNPTTYEVLSDGADGGSAVLAATGLDTPNDWLSIRNKLIESLGRVPLADPYASVPVKISNYFVLNAGEQRLRFITAICNVSATETLQLAVGDLTDPGAVVEYFNPTSCTNGFGFGGLCFGLDRMSWFGYQGSGVAYGYAPYLVNNRTLPSKQNAVLSVAGITGSIIGANGISGLVAWINPAQTPRDGELRLEPFGSGFVARDFWVGEALGDISTLIETSRAATTGDQLGAVSVLVRSGGQPLPGARVVLEGADNARTVLTSGSDGLARGSVPVQAYQVSAWAPGRLPSAKQRVTTSAAQPASLTIDLSEPHSLTVNVNEANAGPMPAKVTVLCAQGVCPTPARALTLYTDAPKDPRPDNVAFIGYVGTSGSGTFALPPGQYLVLVSRGPEYSIHPNDYPTSAGTPVDLRTADATVNATLARVLDTTGWMSADFHVHAVNSPDSIVDNETRALTFAGDGVEVLVSSDHDFVTDYAPVVQKLGLAPFVATVVGQEASPMEFGHYNFFPLPHDANSINGGAIDWAGGDGPTLTLHELFAAARTKGAKTVHFNHPRGALGGFSYLKVDTDTFATGADPVALRMAVQANATAADSKLMGTDFNAIELLNPAEDELVGTSSAAHGRFNDWFTVLSRGFLVAGTGVSDTHYKSLGTGWRTWVELGVDEPAQFGPALLSARLNAMRAVASNGPFVRIKAYRVDSSGAMVTAPVGIGGIVAPDTRELGVQVEVQVPEYLDVTKVELYLHRPEDDTSCPADASSPRAATTRVACGGVMNTNWPASGIAASQVVALTPGDLEVAATEGATQFRRYRKTVTFRLPAPMTDNWLVAMVSGTRTLMPLLSPYPGLTGGVGAGAPFAFTNPILIDADGNGYDHPPFKALAPGQRAPPTPGPAATTTERDIVKRWGEQFGGH